MDISLRLIHLNHLHHLGYRYTIQHFPKKQNIRWRIAVAYPGLLHPPMICNLIVPLIYSNTRCINRLSHITSTIPTQRHNSDALCVRYRCKWLKKVLVFALLICFYTSQYPLIYNIERQNFAGELHSVQPSYERKILVIVAAFGHILRALRVCCTYRKYQAHLCGINRSHTNWSETDFYELKSETVYRMV